MSLGAICQSIQQYIPSAEQVSARFSTSLPQIVDNLNKIAIPIIALYALSNVNTAEAGPISYGVCVSACELSFTQASMIAAPASGGWSLLALIAQQPACAVICAPVLAAPSP